MTAIFSVDRRPFFNPTVVTVLVVCAVFAWVGAVEKIAEIREQVRLRNQIALSVDELVRALNEMSQK